MITKPGFFVDDAAKIDLSAPEQYVSRAGLKLASVVDVFGVDFQGKIVLDVGSSTGGFTDYALQHGAARVYAIDVGTDQLHPSLRGEARIERSRSRGSGCMHSVISSASAIGTSGASLRSGTGAACSCARSVASWVAPR